MYLSTSSSCRRRGIGRGPAARRLQREDDVLPHRQVGDERPPRGGSPSRSATPCVDGLRAGCAALTSPCRRSRTVPLSALVGAEEQPRDLGAAGAEQAGEARRPRPAWMVEVERLDRARRGRGPTRRPAGPRSSSAAGPLVLLLEPLQDVELLADHLLDQAELGQLGGQVLADQRAVAQHGDAVGDLVDLVEEVRDEQDRDALVAQLPHDRGTAARPRRRRGWRSARRGSAPGPRCRWRGRSRPSAGSRAEYVAERRGDVDVEVEAGQQRPRPGGASRAQLDARRSGAARGR